MHSDNLASTAVGTGVARKHTARKAATASKGTKLTAAAVGLPCTVAGYTCGGVILFVGNHATSGKHKVGIELQQPVGKSDALRSTVLTVTRCVGQNLNDNVSLAPCQPRRVCACASMPPVSKRAAHACASWSPDWLLVMFDLQANIRARSAVIATSPVRPSMGCWWPLQRCAQRNHAKRAVGPGLPFRFGTAS